MAELQESGEFSFEAALRHRENVSLPSVFSLCVRFNLNFQRGEHNWLVSFSLPTNADRLHLYLDHAQSRLVFCLSEACLYVTYKPNTLRQRWVPACAVVTETDIALYLRGKEGNRTTYSEERTEDLEKYGILVVGQDQDRPGGGYDYKQSFSGRVSQLVMVARALEADEVAQEADCQGDSLEGDLVTWAEEKWVTEDDVTIAPLARETLCDNDPFAVRLVSIPEPVTYKQAAFVANFLSCRIPSELDQSFYDGIKASVNLTGTACLSPNGEISYWLASDNSTGLEDCRITRFGKKIASKNCDDNGHRYCVFCTSADEPNPIGLRGLCPLQIEEYNIDTEFYPSGIKNYRTFFRGTQSSELWYEPGPGDSPEGRTGQWIVQSLRNQNMELRLEPKNSRAPNPYGSFPWQLGPETEMCGRKAGDFIDITITSCPPEVYTCDSGACIALANKCNSKIECSDESDETNCQYLEVPPLYAGQLSPRSVTPGPIPIYFNVSILAFPEIDTIGLQFTADYYINLRWYDGRLDYKDLNDVSLLNGVPTDVLRQLWTPQLAFTNALGPFQTVVDELSVCTINLENDPTYEDLSSSNEYYGFDGYQNSINLLREYYQQYACEFALTYYPFDTQVCHMVFALQGFTKEFIVLKQDYIGVNYTGKKDLLEYEIQEWKVFIDNSGDMSVAEVKIVFRRKIEYHLLGIFLQQTILIVVGFLTFLFEVTNFQDRVMVSLTLMLVIATISTSIQQGLPSTPYYKMIDYWLLFTMNIMVYTLAFHTFLQKRVKDEAAEGGFQESGDILKQRHGGLSVLSTLEDLANTRPSTAFVEPYDPDKPKLKIENAKSRLGKIFPMPDIKKGGGGLKGGLPKSVRVNTIGTIIYIGLNICFFTVFFIVAISEFQKPASEYMNRNLM